MTNTQAQQLQPIAVLHLSGNWMQALSAGGYLSDVSVQTVEEFIIAKPRQVWSLLRTQRSKHVLIVTKDISYQRFRTIWKLWVAITGAWRLAFIDERGNSDAFRWWRLLAIDAPKLLLEIVISGVVVLVGVARLWYYNRSCT